MTDFVIDEDLPRSTAQALSAADHRVKDIRDHGFATGARIGDHVRRHTPATRLALRVNKRSLTVDP